MDKTTVPEGPKDPECSLQDMVNSIQPLFTDDKERRAFKRYVNTKIPNKKGKHPKMVYPDAEDISEWAILNLKWPTDLHDCGQKIAQAIVDARDDTGLAREKKRHDLLREYLFIPVLHSTATVSDTGGDNNPPIQSPMDQLMQIILGSYKKMSAYEKARESEKTLQTWISDNVSNLPDNWAKDVSTYIFGKDWFDLYDYRNPEDCTLSLGAHLYNHLW